MKIKRNVIFFIVVILFLPVLMAFVTKNNLQQRWWQKNKGKKQQMEFSTLQNESGYELVIHFEAGKKHNHPLMAFWIEDTLGNYIQSLYVAESIAKGYFRHGDPSTGRWQPGPLQRPAALPYWGHKRGVKNKEGYYLPTSDDPMPDAVTGPTPKDDFILYSRTRHQQPEVFNLLMEINQSWDWNQHWHNNKFPDDDQYKTSSQPAIIYQARIDTRQTGAEFVMTPIGHSHWSGASGEVYSDLETLTTALRIAKEVKVQVQ